MVIQSLGRLLRKHHSKNKVTCYDIVDNTYYADNSYKERKQIYFKQHHELEEIEVRI